MNNKPKIYILIIVGQLMVNLPVLLICFGLPVISYFIVENLLFKILCIVLSFMTGLGLSWLIWSFLITKWRIWAFSKVKDNDEELILLKQFAIDYKLIWDDGTIYEKTEIRNKSEKEKIKIISEKVNMLEEIEHIKSYIKTPEKTTYKLSKKDILFESFSMIAILICGIFVLFTKIYFVGLIIIAIILYEYKKFFYLSYLIKDKEHLEMGNTGIKIGKPINRFITWETIYDFEIDKSSKKMRIEYLELNKVQEIEIDLWRYNINDYTTLVKNLKVYVDRFFVRWEERSASDN